MKTDTWVGSMLWGRVGAAILTIVAMILGGYGFEFSASDQQAVFASIAGVLQGIGAVMMVVSKLREQKKVKQVSMDESGMANLITIAAIFMLMAVMVGCSSFTAKYKDLEVSHTRLFEDQEIKGMTFTTNADGSVSVVVDSMGNSASEAAINAAMGALKTVQ